MRKSFDGLCGLIQRDLKENPANGVVYIFVNKQRNRMKLLVWEYGGFTLYYKQLEEGTFELPGIKEKESSIFISWETLVLIISGIKLEKISHRKRYQRA